MQNLKRTRNLQHVRHDRNHGSTCTQSISMHHFWCTQTTKTLAFHVILLLCSKTGKFTNNFKCNIKSVEFVETVKSVKNIKICLQELMKKREISLSSSLSSSSSSPSPFSYYICTQTHSQHKINPRFN